MSSFDTVTYDGLLSMYIYPNNFCTPACPFITKNTSITGITRYISRVARNEERSSFQTGLPSATQSASYYTRTCSLSAGLQVLAGYTTRCLEFSCIFFWRTLLVWLIRSTSLTRWKLSTGVLIHNTLYFYVYEPGGRYYPSPTSSKIKAGVFQP